jgi:hypothetical protein
MTDALALGALIVSMLALLVALLDWQRDVLKWDELQF